MPTPGMCRPFNSQNKSARVVAFHPRGLVRCPRAVRHIASKRQSWDFNPGIWLQCYALNYYLLFLFSEELGKIVLSQLGVCLLPTKSGLRFEGGGGEWIWVGS